MTHEVVVVGAGIGGLTTAALLAARGVDVCVLEKEPEGGGCATTFERFGYGFETTAGLYAGWGADDIHARVFSELPVAPPEARRLAPAYVVRLPDATEVRVGAGDDGGDDSVGEFEDELSRAFPECAPAALDFYRALKPPGEALQRAARRTPALATLSKIGRMKLMATEARHASRVLALQTHTAAEHLAAASTRFRRFIDAQLQIYAGCASDECAYLYAAVALDLPRRGLYALRGGASALARALTDSIKLSGGRIRFDTTALRLAFDADGRAAGVDLLSGETVRATRAVVSNLTVWDTYGKLVGASRTPGHLRARLKAAHGWGAYLLYLGADDEAVRRLTAERLLVLDSWQEGETYDATRAQFMFSASPAWDTGRAPAGKRAVTVSLYTDAADWFAYHTDESEHETQDQQMLEACWSRLHAALPELGAGIEVIETATPRTFYEQTRRKLGMTGGIPQTLANYAAGNAFTHRTPFPNLYTVGDTVFPGNGLAAVTQSALIAADEIAPPRK
ncbi:MAG TPA: NAD(P)/FAD-dependent oxidoreductase [Pyrinomonadaceae bacterium]|jgi:C-3',4' desaturase CrtD|nr:NAD(P)/FAD-dependent oxidoreductase [Pyrinomonadaceae bacterium]